MTLSRKTWISVAAVVVAILFLFPTYWMVTTAFTPAGDITTSKYNLVPLNFTVQHFVVAVSRQNFLVYLRNSLIVTLAGRIYSVFTGVAVIRSGRAYVKAHAASLLKRMAGRTAQLLAVWFGFVQTSVPLLVLATLFLPALHQ